MDLFPREPQPHSLRFDGQTYEPTLDQVRLTGQLLEVYRVMADGRARTLRAIAEEVGCSEASASARLRDLRKSRFGANAVTRKRIHGGLFVYALVVP